MGKTAVLIVHGIGEQRPMVTVRAFASLFAGPWLRSKPDPGSEFYDLRRLSTFASGKIDADTLANAKVSVPDYPTDTDFYEYYWAFHYRDTTVAQSVRWILATFRDLLATKSFRTLRSEVRSIGLRWATILAVAAVGLVAGGCPS
jgi:hypothetical protein